MFDKVYNKSDKEYIKNGHYFIEGRDWMTMWTFKNEYKIAGNNPVQNTLDTVKLKAPFTMFYKCMPDMGQGERHLFSLKDLKEGFGLE